MTPERIKRLKELQKKVCHVEMTDEQKRIQRLNFVYGNCHLSNPMVTMEVVLEAEKRLKEQAG